MSITIIWQTKNRNQDDRGQTCVVCQERIIPRDIAIRDLQTTQVRRYYHPPCFVAARYDMSIKIADFWRNLCNQAESGKL
jgi:hypothetical protein